MDISFTSKAESSASELVMPSKSKVRTPRRSKASIRNFGEPVSNQCALKRRLSNNSRMAKGLYTVSSPSQL